MKKILTLLILPIMFISFSPIPVSAETKAGIGPSSFFYFFDKAIEDINLFFTFNPEKKIQKTLEYADERLAEIEEATTENKPKAVEIATKGYKEEISLATEKSKEIKNKNKAEELLNTVSKNTAKHQEILKGVLKSVPDEAKEAIQKVIEISKKGQEEVVKQITELKKENTELKKEIQDLKDELKNKEKKQELKEKPREKDFFEKDNKKTIKKNEEDTSRAKFEADTARAKSEAERYKLEAEKTKLEIEKLKQENKKIIITLPNGAIVEMDKNGNVTKTIKDAPRKSIETVYVIQPTNSIPQQTQQNNSEVQRQKCLKAYYSRAQIQNTVDKIKEIYRNSANESKQRIESQFGRQAQDIQESGAQRLTSAREAQRGFATNNVALDRLKESTQKQLKDLDTRRQETLSSVVANLSFQIAELQMKQLELEKESSEVMCY